MAMVQLGSKAVGSIVKLKENGKLVDFYIAKHNYESGLNGNGRTLLVRKDCYDQRQWHSSKINTYASSNIDSWLNNTYKNLLDANIRTAMGTTRIYYTPGDGNDTVTTLQRSVFLLSATELGQSRTYMNVEGTALSSTALNLLKIAKLNGLAVYQWTRSPSTLNTYGAWRLSSEGTPNGEYSTASYGSRPAFTFPASLYVSDDGQIIVNTAPSAPASISIPSSISGGTTITVSWGASTDAQGNLEGYKVERSTNGGSSWSQIYQGSGRSTTNSVAFGTVSVMYRVKAYDSEGLESSYKTSGQVTVFNNRAPGKPPSITVPVQVEGGKQTTISWAAATDADGNLSGYALERQVAGGAWSQVYKGAALSYTDTITKGWATVAYRVRSYDSYNVYSDYVTSPTRTVNNNTAPTISCGNASGSDLGTKNAGFSVAYTVNDADGNTVKVTEKLDGVVKRTYNATLGQAASFDITGAYYMQVLNGRHTLTIEANDGKVTTTHTLYFSKAVYACKISLANPLPADAQITVMIMSVLSGIPADANYRIMVTNNAKDTSPVWEDATADVRRGVNHLFTNRTAARGFAFNFILTASRGASGTGGHITSIGGGFE